MYDNKALLKCYHQLYLKSSACSLTQLGHVCYVRAHRNWFNNVVRTPPHAPVSQDWLLAITIQLNKIIACVCVFILQWMLPGKKKGTVLIQLLTAYIDHLTKASRDQVNCDILSLQLLDKLFYARRKPIYQKIEMVIIIPFKLNLKYW